MRYKRKELKTAAISLPEKIKRTAFFVMLMVMMLSAFAVSVITIFENSIYIQP